MSETSHDHADSILRTKLHRPVVRGNFVCRPRLHARLNQDLDTPLTLVSAPAGYGKSLLVSHWVESQGIPFAWLSLDGSDSAVEIFIEYLLAAVETVVPAACPQTSRMVRAADPATQHALAYSLANELDALALPLVLDDYHLIDGSSEVHALLRQLLAHPPRPLHLVIVSRRDPPLRMTELRANGRLTDVRLADLRFTAEETRICVGLCDAVGAIDGQPGSSESGGEVFLQTLQDRNLFTIALDHQGEWSGYHHLCRDLLRVELRKTLGPAKIKVLHQRTSDWFEQHALLAEATHHALRALRALPVSTRRSAVNRHTARIQPPNRQPCLSQLCDRVIPQSDIQSVSLREPKQITGRLT